MSDIPEAKLETEIIFNEENVANNLFESIRPKRTKKKSLKLLEAEETEHNIKILKVETKIDLEDDSKVIPFIPDENPWDIRSIYELQYFNCPKCSYKNNSKQEFIQHAYEDHPEAIDNLTNIVDGSLNDINCPWNETGFDDVKEELISVDFDASSVTDKIYPCYLCSKPFDSSAALCKHRLTHQKQGKDGKKYYNCSACKKKFTLVSSLERHVNRVHKNLDDNPSNAITKKFTRKISQCYFCSKEFKSSKDLFEHRRTHKTKAEDGKMYYNCNDCGKKYGQVNGLKNHINRIHKNVRKCVECKKMFTGLTALKTHMDMYHEKKECDQCDKKFMTNWQLKTHKSFVHDGVKFECEKCDKVFATSTLLKLHYEKKHDTSKIAWHNCTQCNKKFVSNFLLKRHILTVHEGVRDHVCETCGKAFGWKFNLTEHIKSVHKGLHKCQCNICGKNFTEEASMKRHISVVHEGEKPFKCTQCEKSFGQKPHLLSHVKTIHEGVKDNICGVCGKAFSRIYALKDHIKRKHQTVKIKKEYVCGDCGKIFPKPSRLKRHVNITHKGIKEFQCLECGKAYGQKGELIKHNQRIHGETNWTTKTTTTIPILSRKTTTTIRKEFY